MVRCEQSHLGENVEVGKRRLDHQEVCAFLDVADLGTRIVSRRRREQAREFFTYNGALGKSSCVWRKLVALAVTKVRHRPSCFAVVRAQVSEVAKGDGGTHRKGP